MPSTEHIAASTIAGGQVLTFRLGEETYGVDILRVKEIRGWSPATRLPSSPTHVLGVMNLRGAIVPIIDLRQQFGMAHAEPSPLRVIIVLSIAAAAGTRECGVVVDAVSDVVDVAADAVKAPPQLSTSAQSAFIKGLATVDEHMLILLDVDELDLTGSPVATEAAA